MDNTAKSKLITSMRKQLTRKIELNGYANVILEKISPEELNYKNKKWKFTKTEKENGWRVELTNKKPEIKIQKGLEFSEIAFNITEINKDTGAKKYYILDNRMSFKVLLESAENIENNITHELRFDMNCPKKIYNYLNNLGMGQLVMFVIYQNSVGYRFANEEAKIWA